MVQATFVTPFRQVGDELLIELSLVFQESPFASLGRRWRSPQIPLLPEQRVEDEHVLGLRKSELFLQTVRHGAVRR